MLDPLLGPLPVRVPDPDDDAAAGTSLGIIPLDVDDLGAPLGCAALRELRGRPLLHWAATALTASRMVRRVVVAVPPALEPRARAVLAAAAPVPIYLLPVPDDGAGHGVLAVLRATPGDDAGPGGGIVVVHDALHPLSMAPLVRTVVNELVDPLEAAGAVAAVPARPVTDSLKWVDADEVVLGAADREVYRLAGSPQAYRRQALLDALAAAGDAALRAHGTAALPRLVRARGGRVRLVPFPGEVFRVLTDDDLVLADALLAVTSAGAAASSAAARRRRGRADR